MQSSLCMKTDKVWRFWEVDELMLSHTPRCALPEQAGAQVHTHIIFFPPFVFATQTPSICIDCRRVNLGGEIPTLRAALERGHIGGSAVK